MSVNHCKHWRIEHLLVGLQTVVHNRDRLFKSMFNKCWERANFAIYSKKQTVVTRALNSLQDPTEPDIVVIYGDGSFASGGRGQRSVPVKWFKDACKNRFVDAFQEVDEHRTSSICPDCATQLYSVVQFFNGKRYEVRGLMWCSSYKCRGCPFKDRDSHVACNNMYNRYIGVSPPIMERNGPGWVPKTKRYVVMNTRKQDPPLFLRQKHNRV